MKIEPPTTEEMLAHPKKGDLLCYNGKKWCVYRRDDWYYPVPDPDDTEEEL